MGSNAKTSGKWVSKETWKCVVINKETRTRVPFYSHTAYAAKNEAIQYLKSHKYDARDFTLTSPIEIFKTGINWDTAVGSGY